MTTPTPPKMEFDVAASRVSAHASQAVSKQASIAMVRPDVPTIP